MEVFRDMCLKCAVDFCTKRASAPSSQGQHRMEDGENKLPFYSIEDDKPS